MKRSMVLIAICLWLIAPAVSAQDAFSDPRIIDTALQPSNIKIASLIALRLILVMVAVIGAVAGIFAGFNWVFSELDDDKAYDNKRRLAFWLFIITIDFMLMALFKIYVPDYSILNF